MSDTRTTDQVTDQAEIETNKGELVVFRPPRLPYDSRLKDGMDISRSTWRTLVEGIFPNAKSQESILVAWEYCKRRKLDIMKGPVHIVPIWDNSMNDGRGGWRETIWRGINELRITAARTGQLAGYSQTIWGPEITHTFKGVRDKWINRQKTEEPYEHTQTFREWARIDIERWTIGPEGTREKMLIPGPTVYWLEAYARQGKTTMPNEMWQRRANGQLEKCSESASLRRAFPEEVGNEYSAEEMEGQSWGAVGQVIEHEQEDDPGQRRRASAAEQMKDFAETGNAQSSRKAKTSIETPKPETAKKTQAKPMGKGTKIISQTGVEAKELNLVKEPEIAMSPPVELSGWLEELYQDLAVAGTADEASEIWANYAGVYDDAEEPKQAQASTIFDEALAKFDAQGAPNSQ